MWNSYNSCWNDTAEDCGCVAGEGAELSSIDIWFPLYNNWPLLPAPPPPHLSIAVAWDLLFQSSSHIPCMRRAPGNPTRGAASKTQPLHHAEARISGAMLVPPDKQVQRCVIWFLHVWIFPPLCCQRGEACLLLPICHFRKDLQKFSQLSRNNFTQLCTVCVSWKVVMRVV